MDVGWGGIRCVPKLRYGRMVDKDFLFVYFILLDGQYVALEKLWNGGFAIGAARESSL